MQYHLMCVEDVPVTGKDWFCNGDCKADSGVRSKKCRLV
jgi:hypothetical protein